MIYTLKIQKAIKFSIKTHEIYQKQKRKGKDVAYITHPLSVGLILSLANADEDVIIAGILHDTIEDSTTEKKVTGDMLKERFGENVAELVLSVTEKDKNLSWEDRKKEAINHIKHFSNESLLVKSADIISNNSELIDEYIRYGDRTFDRFNSSKDNVIINYLDAIEEILSRWSGNPLKDDLLIIKRELLKIK